MNPYIFLKAVDKYVSCGWMISDTYNAFVMSFGKKFDEFTTQQLIQFCGCLSRAGLRQEDIFEAVVKKLKQFGEKSKLHFNDIYVPLLKQMGDLNLTDNPVFQELTSQEFLKQYVSKDKALEEMHQSF